MAVPVATCRYSIWISCPYWLARRTDVVYGPLVDAQEFPNERRRDAAWKVESAAEEDRKRSSQISKTARCWFRWTIVRSPAMFPRCATRFRSRSCWSGFTWRRATADRAIPRKTCRSLRLLPADAGLRQDRHLQVPGCPPASQGHRRSTRKACSTIVSLTRP